MLPKRGRPGVVLMMSLERELTSEDLFRLTTMNDHSLTAPPVIQRLREVHHAAARGIARGDSVREVAIMVNRTPQRISDLLQDPAFKELVAYYKTQIEEDEITDAKRARMDYVDINDLARGEIIKRLEDPTKLNEVPIDELRRLMTDTGDRTHSPPKTATATVSIPTRITFNMPRDIAPRDETGKIIEHEEAETTDVEENTNGEDQ
jgi:hypothetical protein